MNYQYKRYKKGMKDVTPKMQPEPYLFQLECPVCKQKTNSIKYRKECRIILIFLIFAAFGAGNVNWTKKTSHMCPKCFRKNIVKTLLINLLCMNIFFPLVYPFFFVFVELPQLIDSYCVGHSSETLFFVSGPIAGNYRMQEEQQRAKKREKKIYLWVYLIAILSILCVFFGTIIFH